MGLIWGPWHAPILIAGLNYSGVNPLAAIGIFTLATIGLSLLYTRLVIAAGGAVLVAAVMHGSTNSFSDTLTATEHLTGDQLVVTPGGAVGIVLVYAAVVLLHSGRFRAWGGRGSKLVPQRGAVEAPAG